MLSLLEPICLKIKFFFEKITQQNILTALKIEQAIEQKHRRILASLIGPNLFAKLKFLKQAGEPKSFEMFQVALIASSYSQNREK